MGKSLIVNEQEAAEWLQAGKSNKWLIEEYRRKYAIETKGSMWANRRAGLGIAPQVVHIRDEDLFPWPNIHPRHRQMFYAEMLRAYGRQRAGVALTQRQQHRLTKFLAQLNQLNQVVDYDPAEGFVTVERRGETGLIRVPA